MYTGKGNAPRGDRSGDGGYLKWSDEVEGIRIGKNLNESIAIGEMWL